MLWLRLSQASLGSVLNARGASLEHLPADASHGDSDRQARELGFAGCCLVNARRLLGLQPRPSAEPSHEGDVAWWAHARPLPSSCLHRGCGSGFHVCHRRLTSNGLPGLTMPGNGRLSCAASLTAGVACRQRPDPAAQASEAPQPPSASPGERDPALEGALLLAWALLAQLQGNFQQAAEEAVAWAGVRLPAPPCCGELRAGLPVSERLRAAGCPGRPGHLRAHAGCGGAHQRWQPCAGARPPAAGIASRGAQLPLSASSRTLLLLKCPAAAPAPGAAGCCPGIGHVSRSRLAVLVALSTPSAAQ